MSGAVYNKSLPYHARLAPPRPITKPSRQRLFGYIPSEVASKHGLMIEDGVQTGITVDFREGLCNAVFEMASVANSHLGKARQLAKTVPAKAIPVLLPAVPTQVLLHSLCRVHFDVFDPTLQRSVLGIPPLWFQVKLRWNSWRGRY
ncbi:hypothetical protein SOVF_123510 [Spinacia oleracea]|nr:hypothetical protein SOVF_123510 [Spinacia oleracea]